MIDENLKDVFRYMTGDDSVDVQQLFYLGEAVSEICKAKIRECRMNGGAAPDTFLELAAPYDVEEMKTALMKVFGNKRAWVGPAVEALNKCKPIDYSDCPYCGEKAVWSREPEPELWGKPARPDDVGLYPDPPYWVYMCKACWAEWTMEENV